MERKGDSKFGIVTCHYIILKLQEQKKSMSICGADKSIT